MRVLNRSESMFKSVIIKDKSAGIHLSIKYEHWQLTKTIIDFWATLSRMFFEERCSQRAFSTTSMRLSPKGFQCFLLTGESAQTQHIQKAQCCRLTLVFSHCQTSEKFRQKSLSTSRATKLIYTTRTWICWQKETRKPLIFPSQHLQIKSKSLVCFPFTDAR